MGMQIKKFKAATLQDAIELIRQDLGDGAIILQTRAINESAGVFGRNKIEVTAAIDRKEVPKQFQLTLDTSEDDRAALKATQQEPGKGLADALKFLKRKKESPKPSTIKPTLETKLEAPAAKVELTSAEPSQKTQLESPPSMGQIYAVKTFVEPIQREIEKLKEQVKKADHHPLKRSAVSTSIHDELIKLRAELSQFMDESRYQQSDLSHIYQKLFDYWKGRGVSDKQIHQFFKFIETYAKQAKTVEEAEGLVVPLLNRKIKEGHVFEKTGRRIVVLVGPTGVGKTTTLAKLAAYEHLQLKRKVSFIATDDYKIGGTDQLSHYARILEVPFVKHRTDITLEEQCRYTDAETIFIDTFGVSPYDTKRLETLKSLLRFKDPELASQLEIHCVLPVGVSSADVEETLRAFETLGVQYLLFTKWDETPNWGGMFTSLLNSGKPVSFVCNGQNVPDDLVIFSKEHFIHTVTNIQ